MAHTLTAYKDAIVAWNNTRSNANSLLTHLTEGSYFEITRAMYNSWTENTPDYVHAYLGLGISEDDSLGFMLIDSECDKSPGTVTAENISYAPYSEGFDELQGIPEFSNEENPDSNISVLASLERSFRWMMNRKQFIIDAANNAGENSGIFQVFQIPMSDLDSIFNDPDANSAIVVLGLKEDNTTADLLLWSKHFNPNQTVEDTVIPMPPYHNLSAFNLLQLAIN